MSRRSSATAAAPVVGVLAALAFSSTTAAPWVQAVRTRTVGAAAVEDVATTTGVQLVPLSIVAGVAAAVCGVAMLITRGMARRVVSLLLAVAGAGAVAAAGLGIARAAAADGAMTGTVWLAVLTAALILAAGMLGLGPPARRLPARYDVGVDPADREWRMAADPGEGGRSDHTAP